MDEKVKVAKRNQSIELIRIIAMFVIVCGHCNSHGIYAGEGGLTDFVYSTCTRFHVTTFIAISGLFGITFRPSKFLKLWGLIAFYSALSIIVHCIDPQQFPSCDWRVQGGWFGASYLALMLIAPLVNAGINGVRNVSKQFAVVCGLMFCIVMTCSWMPGHFLTGISGFGMVGFSIGMMIFIYTITRIAVLSDLKVYGKHLVSATLFYALCSVVIHYVLPRFTGLAFASRLINYSAPHVWIFSVVLVLYVLQHVSIPEKFGKICAYVAPSMFGVYLFHDTTCFGHTLVAFVENVVSNSLPDLGHVAVIFVSAMIVWFIAFIVDVVRRIALTTIKGAIDEKLNPLDLKWKNLSGGIK